MKNQYHMDLEKYDLLKFKENLKKRDMIPSRSILKESIEERFKALVLQGVKNLKELIDQLKTKQKIEKFSAISGLDVDYLTILKREASSYLPNPVQLKKLKGVEPKTLEALEIMGIKNTKQLFNRVNKDSISRIQQESGVSKENLEELVSLSDLARLYGVGPVFARIIYDTGIKSVKDFSQLSGQELIKIYEDKTEKRADFGENEIDFSIELAKELINS